MYELHLKAVEIQTKFCYTRVKDLKGDIMQERGLLIVFSGPRPICSISNLLIASLIFDSICPFVMNIHSKDYSQPLST